MLNFPLSLQLNDISENFLTSSWAYVDFLPVHSYEEAGKLKYQVCTSLRRKMKCKWWKHQRQRTHWKITYSILVQYCNFQDQTDRF